MNENFNTNWDPYQQLLTAEHNIAQLVLAVQHSSQLIEQLAKEARHQNEIIKQLIFQNQKLNQTLGVHRVTIDRLNNEVQQLKHTQT